MGLVTLPEDQEPQPPSRRRPPPREEHPTRETPLSREKSMLREQLRARRRARPEPERAAADTALAARLLTLPRLAPLLARAADSEPRGCVAAYASFGTEPRTTVLRAALAAADVGVLLPVIRDDGDLDWAWDRGDLAGGAVSRGVPEPTGPVVGRGLEGLVGLGVRVLLTPALAVDVHGSRIGKAGGYYDRLLSGLGDVPPERRPLVVVVVHDDEVLEQVPTEAHDRPVDAVLTPSRYIVVH